MMKMISRKRIRKRIALFLLLVLFVPFVPLAPVSADVGVPEFPYLSKSWFSTNTDSFALWEVHGSNKVSYVQTRTLIFDTGAFPAVIVSGSWTGHYYYLDYTTITDTWTLAGNHVDGGYSWSQNIRVPAPNEAVVDSEVYATLVYCTTDIMYGDGYGNNGIYAYQNFIVPGYADPTPTPIPQPTIGSWDSFPDLPSNFSSQTLAIMKYHKNGSINDGQLIGIASRYIGRSASYSYPIFYKDRKPYNYNSQAFCNNAITFNTWANSYDFSVFSVNYDESTDVYSVGSNLYSGTISTPNGWYLNYAYNWRGETLACWSVVPNNQLSIYNKDAATYEFDDSYFEILFTNKNYTPGSSSNPFVSPTPTPTAVPTAIPQPSTTPAPTEPPDDGDDGNWTGLFGWLKKLVNAILSIPVKIVNGILDALKYIFIPDIGKIKALFNTLNDKFGINVPGTFEFDPILLKNPENVVMHFKPISLNGEPTEPVDITVIDFDKVDDWLETEQGQIMIRIIQAVFMLTMWGYMIYIFRKHVATINYTDSDTLEHSKYWH